jgi:hypothetical protein
MKVLSRALALMLVLITTPAAAGQDQQPVQPTPVFRAKVDLVRVDVSVTGRGRAPVHRRPAETGVRSAWRPSWPSLSGNSIISARS